MKYRDIDFRPAPTGWRAIYLCKAAPHWFAIPLAGWLVRERGVMERGEVVADVTVDPADREREVVAAVHLSDGGWLVAANNSDYYGEFWYITGPGQDDPTPEEAKVQADHLAQVKAQSARS